MTKARMIISFHPPQSRKHVTVWGRFLTFGKKTISCLREYIDYLTLYLRISWTSLDFLLWTKPMTTIKIHPIFPRPHSASILSLLLLSLLLPLDASPTFQCSRVKARWKHQV